MTRRTPYEYAMEHAVYLADAAINYIIATDAIEAYRLSVEEGDEEYDQDADQQARESVSEHRRSLECAIYEFRKRRDRLTVDQPRSFSHATRPGYNPPPAYDKPAPPPGPPSKE